MGVKKETKGIKFFIRHRHFDVAPKQESFFFEKTICVSCFISWLFGILFYEKKITQV